MGTHWTRDGYLHFDYGYIATSHIRIYRLRKKGVERKPILNPRARSVSLARYPDEPEVPGFAEVSACMCVCVRRPEDPWPRLESTLFFSPLEGGAAESDGVVGRVSFEMLHVAWHTARFHAFFFLFPHLLAIFLGDGGETVSI